MDQRTEGMNTYREIVAKRISFVMQKLNLNQSDVVELAEKSGFKLKQPTLSKMLTPPHSNMTLSNVVSVGNVLKIDLNELLSFDSNVSMSVPERDTWSVAVQPMLITRADAPQMRAYLNRYNAYFFPTKDSDAEILKGTLDFYASENNSRCLASFSFRTGKYDERKQPIIKKYEGDLIISPTMGAAYCALTNESIGEISYLLFSYIPILYEKLKCRIALVLTSSAGQRRMPTVHRMILTEESCSLSDDEIAVIQGQLLLNESEILISEKGLESFIQDSRLDETFKSYFVNPDRNNKFVGVSPVSYYRFDESVIKDSNLDLHVKTNAISLMRQYSTAPKYNKLEDSNDDWLYNFCSRIENKRQTD